MKAEDVPSRDWMVPFLLLSLTRGVVYGRELAEEMAELGFAEMRPGEVYRVLRGMQKEGVVASFRDGGEISPLKRRYEITPAGEAHLEFWAESLKLYCDETDRFLQTYARLDDKDGGPARVRPNVPVRGGRA